MESVSSDQKFPVAQVTPARKSIASLILQSKMWWVTLGCLVAAVFFVVTSIDDTGPTIHISFPEGHGLKVGDSIRHRGIDVGQITSVELASDLHSVSTAAILNASAAGIANKGSRFWIVRPQLSLTGVSGLETAVGSKYVAVDPGDPSQAKTTEFAGLEDPPSSSVQDEGVEVILQAARTHGINPGAAVTYRGVAVGMINRLELSKDSLTVLVSAQIDQPYANLLRKGSQFWVTSGVDVGFGLTGFKLNTDSLATIARGGVSFITPNSRNPENIEPAPANYIFELHEKADDDWIEDALTIEL